MSLQQLLHPQIIDNLSMGLHARFNIKGDVKDIISFIRKFGVENNNDGEWIPSGFPIGKVQSSEHLEQVRKEGLANGTFYNITTGKFLKGGNNTMVYFDGYCVKRNTPEHHAILKVTETEEDSEEEIEIEQRDGWEIIKHTSYIWSSKLERIVGRLREGKAVILSQKAINAIKESSKIPFKQVTEDELETFKLHDF